jgi:hypothetical protein
VGAGAAGEGEGDNTAGQRVAAVAVAVAASAVEDVEDMLAVAAGGIGVGTTCLLVAMLYRVCV